MSNVCQTQNSPVEMDFYFSEQQLEWLSKTWESVHHQYKTGEIEINGTKQFFTESVQKGGNPRGKWNDYEYLGSAMRLF